MLFYYMYTFYNSYFVIVVNLVVRYFVICVGFIFIYITRVGLLHV